MGGGGLGSTVKGSETRMPVSTSSICFSDGCTRHMYDSSMLAWHVKRLPDTVLFGGYPATAIGRQHHVFHGRLGEEAMNLFTPLNLFANFFGLQIN